jgi:hypothetical protein
MWRWFTCVDEGGMFKKDNFWWRSAIGGTTPAAASQKMTAELGTEVAESSGNDNGAAASVFRHGLLLFSRAVKTPQRVH